MLSTTATTSTPVVSKSLYNASANGGMSYEDWQKSGTEFTSIAPQQVNDSVSDHVAAIANSGSSLMKLAETKGLQAANGRGLLNSSMAVGAAKDSVLGVAVPIASQEAAQAADKNTQARAFEYAMTSQDAANEFAASESALERQHQTSEAALDRTLQEKIAKWNLDSTDRANASQFLTNMEAMYNDRYAQIMANENLTADQRNTMLGAALGLRNNELNFVEQMYNVDISW